MLPISSRTRSRWAKALSLAVVVSALAACNKSSTGPDTGTKMLILNSPKAGSSWKVGDSLGVTWSILADASGKGREVSAIEVFLSPDGGVNWGPLTGSRAIQSGSTQWATKSFKWKITDSLYIQDLNQNISVTKTPQACLVMIRDYSLNSDPDLADTSGNITINP